MFIKMRSAKELNSFVVHFLFLLWLAERSVIESFFLIENHSQGFRIIIDPKCFFYFDCFQLSKYLHSNINKGKKMIQVSIKIEKNPLVSLTLSKIKIAQQSKRHNG